MHLLFVAAEADPYARTGGLAETVASLARAQAQAGHQVSVVLPLYREIHLRRREVFAARIEVPLGGRAVACSLLREAAPSASAQPDFYFVDCPALFDRDGIYGTPQQDFPDNAERFTVFSRAAIELARRLRPGLIHAHDWHSALVPVLLRTQLREDQAVGRLPVVFTIHNLGYQGLFPPEVLARLGLSWSLFRVESLEFWGRVNFLKGGLVYADAITTVSPGYSQEIQTPQFGMGLEGVLQQRAADLHGILNGIDTSVWDPAHDPRLAAAYDAGNLEGKQACRQALLRQLGLDRADRPVVAIISRLARQKGIDLIDAALERIAALDLTLVVLGQGEGELEDRIRDWSTRFPQSVRACIRYDEDLAHRLMAGADLLLMPSRYEPCGLTQLHAMRYGTVPVVRAVGGLKDSVREWNAADRTGTGFCFGPFDPDALLQALQRAVAVWTLPAQWRQLQGNGMAMDWSWRRAAAEYAELYRRLRPGAEDRSGTTGNFLRRSSTPRI